MRGLTPKHIAAAVGGTLVSAEDLPEREVTAVVIDTRKIVPGCLYIPIRGERVNGHDLIPSAMEKGAALVLTEEAGKADGVPHIDVSSTTEALRSLAAFYLKGLEIPVVSVTGSVGKTSTKEMIASVLSRKYRTLKTEGNFNNEIGLPLTIFRLTEQDEVAVLEMGISHFGDMTTLASIAPPDVSVITNIGTAHLEYLKDRDGIFRAKTEVFAFLKENGAVILNGEDDKLCAVTEVNGKKPVFFGKSEQFAYYADHIEPLGFAGIACDIHMPKGSFRATIHAPGLHMVDNALAAAAVGAQFGLTAEEIRKGIEGFSTIAGRFRILDGGGVTLIDDSYNANPASVEAALDILKDAAGRRVAVLGDMGELGDASEELHRRVGTFASALKLDLLVTAGPMAAWIADAAEEGGASYPVLRYSDTRAAAKGLPSVIQKGDTVLVKASRFMHFEEIVKALGF